MKDEFCIVPDTSVIIDGRITAKLKAGDFKSARVIISEALVSELEAQANRGKEMGFKGLEELKELSDMAKRREIILEFTGKRPSLEQIKLASGGEIDAMIRAIAVERNALFMTSDRVQSEVAQAKGLNVEYMMPFKEELKPISIENYFTDDTLSVHLKVNVPPCAKKGSVGKQKLVQIRDDACTEKELQILTREFIERVQHDPDSHLEIEYEGVMVFQIGSMRIAVARQPFSDGMEITAVRPIAQVCLDDYRLSKELKARIVERQRGILVAGPPGAGKSTFAASVAQELFKQGFIVKTMESPRDLQVADSITQYAPIQRDMEKTADILLLVRPDYTIYDEVRKTKDFQVFADMRMAGVGMIGVVHATRGVDAIQRLIGRVELGIIPQVVDTVIFIDKGEVLKVYDVIFTVKVPVGMVEQDLARPVITIADFETGMIEFEIYTYGEQVVVMPVTGVERKRPGRRRLAFSKIEKKPKEKESGIKSFIPAVERTRKYAVLTVKELSGETVDIYSGDEYLFTATVGRKGDIKIGKETDAAFLILENPSIVALRLAREEQS